MPSGIPKTASLCPWGTGARLPFRLAASLLFLLCAGLRGSIASPPSVIYEGDVPVKLRDGTVLRANIYRPREEGLHPVLLEGSPYDKNRNVYDGLLCASRGYIFIIYDVRGRFGSGGEWYPFRHEGQDAYDCIEWAAALPYSNGKVGLLGTSYAGVPVMLGAMERPPHLVAIHPGITASDYHDNWVYPGGAFSLMLSRAWSGGLAQNATARQLDHLAPAAFNPARKSPSAYLIEDIPFRPTLGQYYADWIAHPAADAYWLAWSIEAHYDRIQVPALHLAAWYDLFLPGSLRNYEGLKAQGGSAAARQGQRLVVIPGGHAGFERRIGAIDFGADSVLDTWDYALSWFDWVIKGIDNGMARAKPVRLFIMGTNVWRDEDEWPLARARETRYFLHSHGSANSVHGDGALDRQPAGAAEPADRYVADPEHPVPTRGGAILGGGAEYPPGPLDQAKIEERRDVLVYSTPAFAENVEVTGPVRLELFISSSAPDTDFTAKLVDVWPDGTAINITDGVLRARYRDSMQQPTLLQPGVIHRLHIDLAPTATVFLAGHSLRLEVASSNFPRFDLNPQTGADPETARTYAPATNVIHHDRDHPSALILPIIPAGAETGRPAAPPPAG